MKFSEWVKQNYSSLEELVNLEGMDKLLEEYQKTVDINQDAMDKCRVLLQEMPSDLDIDEIIDFIDELPNCHFRGYLSCELARLGDYSDDSSDYIDKIETVLEYNFK